MENQIQVSRHDLSTPLNDKEVEIAKIVWHVNQLISYPLSDLQIESWARTINEYYSTIDLDILRKIIKDFKVGRRKWDYHEGIQNICEALTDMRIIDDETVESRKKASEYNHW